MPYQTPAALGGGSSTSELPSDDLLLEMKLKHHAAEAGGVRTSIASIVVVVKLKYHRLKPVVY